MLKGFSVQQVLGAAGPANTVLYLNGSGVPTGSTSGFQFNGSNIGLNSTPSAWGAALASGNLELAASALFTFGASGGGVVTNAFYNSSNQWVYRATAAAALYQHNAGSHTWFVAASGTGGNVISWVQALQLDVSANCAAGAGAVATAATDGFLYVPTCAGTPTGVPTAKTGYAPIVVNTTNNKLYFYSGGSWRDAGP